MAATFNTTSSFEKERKKQVQLVCGSQLVVFQDLDFTKTANMKMY